MAGPSPETATAIPPAGAGLESAIVHVLVWPALRLVGLHDRAERSNGLRFKLTVVVELSKPPVFKLAVMETLWLAITLPAVVVKVVELAPAGTVTDPGIVSSELLAVSFNVRGLTTLRFNVTVQVLELFELNDAGLQLREDTAVMGTTAKEAV